MNAISKILVATLVLVVLGGAIFLAGWDMPPPSKTVEKVIPNDPILR